MQAEVEAGPELMPLFGFMGVALLGSQAKAKLVSSNQKEQGFGALSNGTQGEGPGRWRRLLITGLLGESYQALKLARDSEGYYLGHELA